MLTEKEKQKFVKGWKNRQKVKETSLQSKHSMALEKAQQIGKMIKEKYHAQRVFLFGSLVNGYYWEHSDIDLAVSGFDDVCYLDAFWDATQLASPFDLDLVILEDVPKKLGKKILKEGTEI